MDFIKSLFRRVSADVQALQRADKKLESLFATFDKMDDAKKRFEKKEMIQQIVALATAEAAYDPNSLCEKALRFFMKRIYDDKHHVIVRQGMINQGIGGIVLSTNEKVSYITRKEGVKYLNGVLLRRDIFSIPYRSGAVNQIKAAYQSGSILLHQKDMEEYYDLSRSERDDTVREALKDFCRWASERLLQGYEMSAKADELRKYNGDNEVIRMGKKILDGSSSQMDEVSNTIAEISARAIKEEVSNEDHLLYVQILGESLLAGKLKGFNYTNSETLIGRAFSVLNRVATDTVTQTRAPKAIRDVAGDYICDYVVRKREALNKEEYDCLRSIQSMATPAKQQQITHILQTLGSGKTSQMTDRDLERVRQGGFSTMDIR